MRKKLLSATYLWKSTDYTIKFIVDGNLDYYACIKEIKNRREPFVISNGTCLIDSGYTIVEILPKNENYLMRIFLNENKEVLQCYFDISMENGLDKDSLIPYYDDLYLDITYHNGEIELLDYNELVEALQNGEITKEEFHLAQHTASSLMEELKQGTNKYLNMDILKEFCI